MSITTPDLDLRDLLSQGIDPLETVVQRARQVAAGGRLVLVAPFDPLPLRRVLGRMGFSSTTRAQTDGGWRVDLTRDGGDAAAGSPAAGACQGPSDVGAPLRREADGWHIDVRGLLPPLPMRAILRLCARLEASDQVVVHHDREPHYLYPELAELGWQAEPIDAPEGEVRLRLSRAG